MEELCREAGFVVLMYNINNMDKPKLSVVILTKNEEQNIERCLRSVAFADEIILIDDESTDKTMEIAKKYKVQIFKHKLEDNFSAQRNFGLKKAKGEWILYVDADEEVAPFLFEEIINAVKKDDKCVCYFINRRDYWLGREIKHGDVSSIRGGGLIRLVKKNSGQWTGKVHETYESNGDSGKLLSYMNHYPHSTIKDFIDDINHYSTLRAKELREQGKKTNIFEIISLPLGKFILNFFLKRGFLDGSEGFAYAFLMSFHSFLVRAKLFQYTKYPTEK